MSTKSSITAIIVTKNEENMIVNCLETLRWCDEWLVIDSGSTDATIELAETAGARVINYSHPSMAKIRNEGLKRVKTDWLFYIDADERVTPTLAREIMVLIETQPQTAALRMARQNIQYGKVFEHGGWNQDAVTRIFRKNALEEWFGDIHESPRFNGELQELKTPLIHLTHRNTVDGLKKTTAWTPIEADLLFKARHPRVTLITILRKGVMEFLRRAFFKGGYKDGMEGMVEAVVQGINRMLVYIQLWERQRKPSLTDMYQRIEKDIAQSWQKIV